MKRIIQILFIIVLLLPVGVQAAPDLAPDLEVTVPYGPTFWVHEVQRNDTISLRIENMPAGKNYQVFLSFIGNKFGQGMHVGDLHDYQGVDFIATFDIPYRLHNQRLLAVMVRDFSDERNYAYNIFANLDDWNSLTPYSLYPVDHSSSQSAGTSVAIFTGPEFAMHDVNPNKTFSINVTGFEGDTPYYVYLGTNDENFEGSLVGKIPAEENYTFSKTFMIPSWLWYKPELKVVLEGQFTEHSGATAFTNVDDWEVLTPYGEYTTFWINSALAAKAQAGKTPFTSIVNVVKDTEVTVQAFNFPADTDFHVTMGRLGTEGIGGFIVGSENSGETGDFYATFEIPGQLQGEQYIAIRFQSKTSGHFAYDFFPNLDGYNFANNNITVAGSGDWVLPIGTYPNTVINSSVLNTSVTVSGFNFTKNDTYNVYMGAYGTAGVGGILVGTVNAGNLGTFTETFTIPPAMFDASQIAIRFESQNTIYYAYDFWLNQ